MKVRVIAFANVHSFFTRHATYCTNLLCLCLYIYAGEWLAAGGPERRQKVIIATKVSGPGRDWISRKRTSPEDPAAPPPRLSARDIRAACEGSLRRLQTDYIDLYQLHWPCR
jgi:aryl-alcohol dehydrogenase-like predicted oxidoreductase